MKVAICMSGHLRELQRMAIFHKKFFEKNQADCFLATWDNEEIGSKSSAQIDEALDILKPKMHKIYCYDVIYSSHIMKYENMRKKRPYEAGFHKNRTGADNYNYYFMMRAANHLKMEYEIKKSMLYDVVIRSRPDIRIFDLSVGNINPNDVHFPKNSFHAMMTDNCFMAASATMDKLCSCYDLIDYYLLVHNVKWVSEYVMEHHYKQLGLNLVSSNFTYGICDAPQRVIGYLETGLFDVEMATKIFGIPSSRQVFQDLQSKKINNIEAIEKLEYLFKMKLLMSNMLL